jgi:hypothetical protein
MSGRDESSNAPRPWDPAGTQPKHDPDTLLPERAEPLLPPDAEVVESDAVDVDGGDMLPERRRRGGAPAVAAAAPGGSAYSSRFHFLTGALVAMGVAALVGIAVLIIGPSTTSPGPPWSKWKPTTGGVDGARQIADHVAGEYRQNGEQLVNVQTNGLEFRGIPLTVALRQRADQGGNIQIHEDSGLLYQMCGLGPNCSIQHGKPSRRRTLLLRREGLELALYSFRYLSVKQVVVLIPPPPGRVQTIALYFRQPDLRNELNHPLTSSLVARAPSVGNVTEWPDASLVDHATDDSYVFTLMGSSFNDRGFLVLDPYTPATDERVQRQLRQQASAAASAAAGATP